MVALDQIHPQFLLVVLADQVVVVEIGHLLLVQEELEIPRQYHHHKEILAVMVPE
jgi:hypothetical protein